MAPSPSAARSPRKSRAAVRDSVAQGPEAVPRLGPCVDGLRRGRARTLEPAEVAHPPRPKFGLKAEHVLRPASTLSADGERTRAALALLQGRGVNLLVLDEPTNHLDLPAIEQLESALDSYEGTLLLVTHDRRMLDAVRTTRRLEVASGKVTER
ncbi:hypothetical protein SALBM311S_09091 [Streptomyces alboniger]